jgi:hypothetical protein
LSTLSDSSITYAVTNCSASARPCQNNSSTANAAASAIQIPDQARASRKLIRCERRFNRPRSSASIASTNTLKSIQKTSTGWNLTTGRNYFPSPLSLRRRQAILFLQAPLHAAEDQAIHGVAENDDENHHCHHLVHIAEIASHHQQLAQTETEKNHFGLN